MRELNVRPADIHPRATQEIPQMQEVIGRLVEAGVAYPARRRRVLPREGAGRLRQARPPQPGADGGGRPRRSRGGQRAPHGLHALEGRQRGRACLGEPLGTGPPRLAHRVQRHGAALSGRASGTCTAAAWTSSSPTMRTRSPNPKPATGAVPFVRHWVHNAMMQLGDEKMAKSLGNIITIRAAAGHLRPRRHPPLRAQRPLPLPAALLRGEACWRPNAARSGCGLAVTLPLVEPGDDAGDSATDTDGARQRFLAAMDDDLGTPQALAVLFDLAHAIQPRPRRRPGRRGWPSPRCGNWAECWVSASRPPPRRSAARPSSTSWWRSARASAPAQQFEWADRIRTRLAELGIALEDGRDGTTWRRRAGPPEPDPAPQPPAARPEGGPSIRDSLRF